jgi:ribonucleotide reductase beta subunit family protein with ferritin-like domain
MNRYTLHPIRDKESWRMYKKHEAMFWTAEEINFVDDKEAFEKLKTYEQKIIINILSFFSSADFLVGINLNKYFLNNPKNSMETDFFYAMQGAMENVHSEVYSLMITNLIKDEEIRNKLFNAMEHFPFIKLKLNWVKSWIDKENLSYPQRLFAFTLVEGLLFSSSFSTIMYFKKRGVEMNGLIQSNELICRDEYLHMSFSLLMFNRHNVGKNKLSQEEVEKIVQEACEIEKSFAKDLLYNPPILGLSLEHMETYIEFLANMILAEAGYEKMFLNSLVNPFDFMKVGFVISTKTNFFERRATEYQLANNEEMDNNIVFPE